jgi:hypothetical protein
MSMSLAISFATQCDGLDRYVRERWVWPSPDAGFGLLVSFAGGVPSAVPPIHSLPWPETSALRYPQALAAAGYLMACGYTASERQQTEWAESAAHLTERDAFPLDRQSFAFRPLEVTGVAVGAARCSDLKSDTKTRLAAILSRLPAEGNTDLWSTTLYSLAASIFGPSSSITLQSPEDGSDPSVFALMKWVVAAYPGHATAEASELDAIDRGLLQGCAVQSVNPVDIGQAAVLLYSLRRAISERLESSLRKSWPVNRNSSDALRIIESLCRRFPLFAKQLQHRRRDVAVAGQKGKEKRPTVEMKDEYDVQDVLHALLKLHFDDVRPEEWAPSYGGGQSRIDFILKAEKIVIETKFMRDNMSQGEVAKQLAVDEKAYQTHPDCKTLVCFVFDPNGRCDNPVALERDASGQHDDFRTLVIVSPKGT